MNALEPRIIGIVLQVKQYIVVTGSPLEGYEFHGLFINFDTAVEWANDTVDDDDWWISELHTAI